MEGSRRLRGGRRGPGSEASGPARACGHHTARSLFGPKSGVGLSGGGGGAADVASDRAARFSAPSGGLWSGTESFPSLSLPKTQQAPQNGMSQEPQERDSMASQTLPGPEMLSPLGTEGGVDTPLLCQELTLGAGHWKAPPAPPPHLRGASQLSCLPPHSPNEPSLSRATVPAPLRRGRLDQEALLAGLSRGLCAALAPTEPAQDELSGLKTPPTHAQPRSPVLRPGSLGRQCRTPSGPPFQAHLLQPRPVPAPQTWQDRSRSLFSLGPSPVPLLPAFSPSEPAP